MFHDMFVHMFHDMFVPTSVSSGTHTWMRMQRGGFVVSWYMGFEICWVNDPFLGTLCPSKSGQVNKHIVKHIVKLWVSGLFVGLAGLMPHSGCPVPVKVRTNEQSYHFSLYRTAALTTL